MRKVVVLSALVLAIGACSKKKGDSGNTSEQPSMDEGSDGAPVEVSQAGVVSISAVLPAGVDLDKSFAVTASGSNIPSFEGAISSDISSGQISLSINNPALWLQGDGGDAQKDPSKGVIIAAVKTGKDVFETGASMQFIEVPVAGGNSLVKLPTDFIENGTDLDLGTLTVKNGDLEASAVSAEDITSLEASVLNELSGTDDGLKAARNSFMNGELSADPSLRPEPQYMFSGNLGAFYGTGKDGTFQPVEIGAGKNTTMRSFLLRIDGRIDSLKVEDLCRESAESQTVAPKELIFYPPVKNSKGEAQAPELAFFGDFCDKTPDSCPKRTVLTSKGSYINEAGECDSNFDDPNGNFFGFKVKTVSDNIRKINFNWGSGYGFYGEVPAGLWDLKLKSSDGEKLIGRFDLASAYPLKTVDGSTYPVIYVPQIKIERAADKRLTTVEIKWNMWNPAKGALEEVKDLTLFNKLVEEVSFSVDDHTETVSVDGENLKADIKAGGNSFLVDFSKAKKPWVLPDAPTGSTSDDAKPEVEELGVGYTLYGTSYRFGFRVQNIPKPD